MTHSQLIARLEQLTAPDREVDGDLWLHLFKGKPFDTVESGQPFTASVDAALALAEKVLPGWYWLKPNIYLMAMYRPGHGDTESVEHTGYHPVNAIALCIAILKAHGASK